MVMPIAQLGQEILWEKAGEVPLDEIPTEAFQQFLDQMEETLEEAEGVGLAAPQVFAGRRVFLALIRAPEEGKELEFDVFINPRIVAASQEQDEDWEGCLSFLELRVLVRRYRAIRLEYYDRHGQRQTKELRGFPARVVQHEYDHLDGILTLDRAATTHDIIKTSELEAVRLHRSKPTEPPAV